jgi:hypothetical protein
MPAFMKRILPVLVLAIGGCGQLSMDPNGGAASPTAGTAGTAGQTTQSVQSPAVQALQQVSNTATDASTIGSSLGGTAFAASAAAVAQTASAVASLVTDLAGMGASKSATVPNPSQRLEVKDVYTDLNDPDSQRALVPYLLHPDTWTLIKCEMPTPTSRHFQFQRITTGDSRALPEVDIFKTGK